ncbi:MAG: ABC transporter ATP-binding protein [Clostridiales bacterium]|nr:ABC transporter ATP-binding protein [Clostridiales bacterium]MBR4010686.1 ABC transporter ATP-binding protein [Clostridiales bacterium]
MSKEKKEEPSKKNKEKKKKLSFAQTVKNDLYAVKLAASIDKRLVIAGFLLMLFGYFEWVFYDGIFMRKIVNALDTNQPFNEIMWFIAMTGVVFLVLRCYTKYAENVTLPLGTIHLYGGIYKKLFAKAKNVELRCYEDSDFYDKYTMAMDGAEEKVAKIVQSFWGVIVSVPALAAVFYFMFEIDHYAVLFIISPLIGNFIFGNYKQKYEYKRYQAQVPQNKVHNYVNRMMYLPDGAKEIRLSNVFSLLKEQYQEATKKNVKAAVKYAFANCSLSFWRITFTFTIIFEGVLFYAIYRNLVSKTITLAQLTIMTSLMVAMTWILIRAFENVMDLIKNGVFMNNLRTFLEYEEKIPQDQKGEIPEGFESLEFKNVCFSYKDEETIKDLSFRIDKGDIVALVGHNGAGKTTIIKLLLRFYDPTSGEILLNGKNIKEYDLRAYRRLFATTFQDFAIFAMSIKENVLMGRHYENEEEIVHRALRRAGILEKVESLPKGVDTIMTKEFDKDGAVFSGGQHQKLAVARTFAKESPVKIFDEPSSALDPIAEYELFKNIMKEGRDHTMVFISHRLSSVKNCDKVFMLEKGTIIERGDHRELIDKKGKYAKMYIRQAMNYLAVEKEEEVIL